MSLTSHSSLDLSLQTSNQSLDQRFKSGESAHLSAVARVINLRDSDDEERSTDDAVSLVATQTFSESIPEASPEALVRLGRAVPTRRIDKIKALFSLILPQAARANWMQRNEMFPRFQQNVIVPLNRMDIAATRDCFQLHPTLTTTPSALLKFQDLVNDEDSHWQIFISEVDNFVTEVLTLTHSPLGKAFSPSEKADMYRSHLAIRVQLAFLSAVAFHNTGMLCQTGATAMNIGLAEEYKQALHHSSAPGLGILTLPAYIQEQGEKFDPDLLTAELEALPPTFRATCVSASGSVGASVEKARSFDQVARAMKFFSWSADVDSLVEALEEPKKSEFPAKVVQLSIPSAGTGAVYPLSEESLFFLLQNCTYLAEGQLNYLDAPFELSLRDDIAKSDGLFSQVCTGGLTPQEYIDVIQQQLVDTTESECSKFIERCKKYDAVLIRLEEAIKIVTEIVPGLSFAIETSNKPPDYDATGGPEVRPDAFPQAAALREKLNQLKDICEKADEAAQQMSSQTVHTLLSPSLFRTILLCSQKLLSNFTTRSWWDNADCTDKIRAFQKELAMPDEIGWAETRSIPGTAKDRTSLLGMMLSAHRLLSADTDMKPVMESISEDLSSRLKALTNKMTLLFAGLSPGQQLYFQHMLTAKILPSLNRHFSDTVPPLSAVSRTRIEAVDESAAGAALSEAPVSHPAPLTPQDQTHAPSTSFSDDAVAADSPLGSNDFGHTLLPDPKNLPPQSTLDDIDLDDA